MITLVMMAVMLSLMLGFGVVSFFLVISPILILMMAPAAGGLAVMLLPVGM